MIPVVAPPAVDACHRASARLRSWPSGLAVVSSDSAAGEASAAAAPCDHPGDDQHDRPAGQAAAERRDGEQHQADDQQPATAEQVGEPSAGQQQ